jgi:RNA polymerase-binding transcription factor DksA
MKISMMLRQENILVKLSKFKEILILCKNNIINNNTCYMHQEKRSIMSDDISSAAVESEINEINFILKEEEYYKIKLIDDALLKIEQNKFGKCEDCSNLIDEIRLNYLPYAIRCIKCQEIYDKITAD